MSFDTEILLNSLLDSISTVDEVQSIGISGGKSPLPLAGEGDIDVFIYCDTIPGLQARETLMKRFGSDLKKSKINVFEGGHWGTGDFVLINGIETWLMYFSVNETLSNIEAIVNGEYPDKIDNYYYPVGRCAMLKNINIIYDKNNFLYSMKNRLSRYPDNLTKKLVQYHLDELEDREDLERAVTREDVLFYHFAMDIAIDHFLQALFAINKTYFPSRKRSIEFIEKFTIKPEACCERLLEVIKLGSSCETINNSYELWKSLVNGIHLCTKQIF